MAGSEADLLDVNVWLALTVREHRLHGKAQDWVATQSDRSLAFCRVTQMALLRHLANPTIMGPQVCTLAESWRIYDAALTRSGTLLLSEPAGLEACWRAYTQVRQPAGKLWTDAYLAAFAHGHGLRLVTFDQGLARYEGVDLLVLNAST